MQQTRVTLEPHESQVRVARQHVAAACADMQRDLVEIALLLVSELVTNAIRHGRGVVELAIKHFPSQLCIEVTDSGPGSPSPQSPQSTQTRGRGLLLVEQLANRWGVAPASGNRKTVWFLLDAAPTPGAG